MDLTSFDFPGCFLDGVVAADDEVCCSLADPTLGGLMLVLYEEEKKAKIINRGNV